MAPSGVARRGARLPLLLLPLLLASCAPALLRRAAAAGVDSGRYSIIPDVPPYPKVAPVDSGYPKNLPAGLPTTLPAPPPVLAPGPQGGCGVSVRDVLAKNKRSAFIQLLSASAAGRQVLDGTMAATVLAPTDAAVAALRFNQWTDPLSLSTVAHYHVLQGKLPLSRLLAEPGLWLNTTLTRADCPTAFQTLTVMPGNSTAVRCGACACACARVRGARRMQARRPACSRTPPCAPRARAHAGAAARMQPHGRHRRRARRALTTPCPRPPPPAPRPAPRALPRPGRRPMATCAARRTPRASCRPTSPRATRWCT